MARNVHWRISFRTRSEKLGVLNLYEDNYSGEVVELTPAAVPFETQEDSSDKWLEPIRKQSGYIRVIDEGNTEGIMPVGLKDRYVEYTEDGSLKWCGYMVPDVFSSDWDVTPLEVEFPVVGGLGVLEGLYLNDSKSMDVVPLANILHECLSATGIDYDYIYIPKEVLQSSEHYDYLFPLKLKVSRFNFFAENDTLNYNDGDWTRYVGSTCFDAIGDIMKFWGWTIREKGTDVWITSTVNQGSVRITMNQLMLLGYGGNQEASYSINPNTFNIDSLEFAGADHKQDILQGRKKIIVKGGVNPVGSVIPSVEKDRLKNVGSTVVSWSNNDKVFAYEKRVLYTPKDGYFDVKFNSYAKKMPSGGYDTWTPVEQNMLGVQIYVGAYFIEQERVSADDYKKKKNWNLSPTIRINLEDFVAEYPTIEEARRLPVVEMRSRKVANYVNGAFVISAATRALYQGLMTDWDGNGKGMMEIKFRVGDKYWDGSNWSDSESWFDIQIGNEEDPSTWQGSGKIISTKTLDMPYNGADGYVMPITEPISGEVELIIHAVRNDGGYKALMLDNFKVDYYPEESEDLKSDESENRYARNTGIDYREEEEISLKMATANNNKAGYGILSRYGENVEEMFFLKYGSDRPEMNLVKKAVDLYGRNTEKLTLQVDKVNMNPQDLMSLNNKKYMMASESVNWAEETAQYIIMEL